MNGCVNTEEIDIDSLKAWNGERIAKRVRVAHSEVRPDWRGSDANAGIPPAIYTVYKDVGLFSCQNKECKNYDRTEMLFNSKFTINGNGSIYTISFKCMACGQVHTYCYTYLQLAPYLCPDLPSPEEVTEGAVMAHAYQRDYLREVWQ